MKRIACFFASLSVSLIFLGCARKLPEMTLEEIAQYRQRKSADLTYRTQYKPYKNNAFVDGKVGGTWYGSISQEPKTFNCLVGESDAYSAAIISKTLDYILDYDSIEKKWKGRIVDYDIEVDEKNQKLIAHFKLKDDLYWTWYASDRKVPVTSDDVVYWYNEVEGDPECQSGAYSSQFLSLPDGSEAHIDCIKVDEKRFDLVYPRIIANPMLSSNLQVNPSFLYREAKEKGGIKELKKIFNASCNVLEIPSIGQYYITEYVPGQRLVYKRNPYYWEKNSKGEAEVYPETCIYQIVANESTEYLLFKQGKLETYEPRPEELDSVIENQGDDYTVFRADGSLGAGFWVFNENPKNKAENHYKWFTKKEFRQAMSCLLNRDRIVSQTYRGLAEPKYGFFSIMNPYYNPEISLKYKYDKEKAVNLLKKIGIEKKDDGLMYDSDGNSIEFDVTVPSSAASSNDIAQIIADEASSVGIKVNIRQIDFQKMVELLTESFEWQSMILALGSNNFPTQGSNVWPSYSQMHLWYPCQEKPATDWEARVDYLYNKGYYTIDKDEAKKIWDEYQEIFLEQLPLIYLMRSKSFFAIRNKWNLDNFYFDNRNGSMTEKVFLKSGPLNGE